MRLIICDNKKENIDKKIIYLKKYNINNKNEEKSESINLKNEQNIQKSKRWNIWIFYLKNKSNEPKLDSKNEEFFKR